MQRLQSYSPFFVWLLDIIPRCTRDLSISHPWYEVAGAFLSFIIQMLILGLAIFSVVIHATDGGGHILLKVDFLAKPAPRPLTTKLFYMVIMASCQLIFSLKKHQGANSCLKSAIDI